MKKNILIASSILATTLLFTGCGIKTNEYNVSADNVQKLRSYDNLKIDVSTFTATNKDESSVMCRLAETISTPQGEPFSDYIKEAFVSELKMAGIYDNNADLKISGNLNKIYGSSMLGNAYWEIDVTISSSNGKSLKVNTKRDYPSTYLATTACSNMGTSFAPTIKQLIGEIINHEDFITLTKN